MDILTKKHDDNWYFSWVIASTIWYEPFKVAVKYFGNHVKEDLGIYLVMATMLLYAAYVSFLVIPRLKITKDMLIVLAFLVASWTFSFLNNSNYVKIYGEEGLKLFVLSFPFYCIIKQIQDFSACKELMLKSACLALALMLIKAMAGFLNNDFYPAGASYDQTSGVYFAPACVVFLITLFEKKRLSDLLMFVLSTALLVFYGARMPIACVLIALALCILKKTVIKKYYTDRINKTHFSYAMAAVAVFLFALLIPMIVFGSLKNDDASSNRVVNMIVSGKLAQDNARTVIHEAAKDYIEKHPFQGSGIINDRLVLARDPRVITRFTGRVDDISKWTGIYAHNIFLEIMMQYGLLLGLIICGVIVSLSLYSLVENNEDRQIVTVLPLTMTYGILLFSGPAFNSKWFWILMGMGTTSVLRIQICSNQFTHNNEHNDYE